MSVGKRLTELYIALQEKNIVKNKQEFSIKMRIEYKNLSKYFRDELKYEINQYNYDVFSSLNISIGWLLTGQGSMFKEENEKKDKEVEKLKEENAELKKSVAELEGRILDTQEALEYNRAIAKGILKPQH
jgi:hypothetical protein